MGRVSVEVFVLGWIGRTQQRISMGSMQAWITKPLCRLPIGEAGVRAVQLPPLDVVHHQRRNDNIG